MYGFASWTSRPELAGSDAMSSVGVGVAITLSFLFYRLVYSRPASSPTARRVSRPEIPALASPTRTMLPKKGIKLHQVYHPTESETITDIDIIAIHGLDTRSPDTWVWRPNGVNWLADPHMLPSKVGSARVFTCDWPSHLFQKSIPTTLEESAEILLRSLRGHLEQNGKAGKDRPLFFIASCLGGIILVKAFEMDRDTRNGIVYPSLATATRGIVFLATPFQGTAFKDMPDWALKAWASLKDQAVTALLDYTKGPTSHLDELVRRFIKLSNDNNYHVRAFWEADKTALLSKVYMDWMFSDRIFVAWPTILMSSWLLDAFSPWLLVLCLLWLLGFLLYQSKQVCIL